MGMKLNNRYDNSYRLLIESKISIKQNDFN